MKNQSVIGPKALANPKNLVEPKLGFLSQLSHSRFPMDGALVDAGSHHPKKWNDNHYMGLCVEYRIEFLFLFFFFLLLEQIRTWFS